MTERLYVDIQFDKPRRLKLGIMDVSDAIDYLNRQSGRQEEMDTYKVLMKLGALDWKAWGAMLWAGLKSEDDRIKTADQAQRMLSKYLESGGSLAPLSKAIQKAMYLSGALPREIYEALDGFKDEPDPKGEPDDSRPFAMRDS
jgi:hypothetical protein